MMNESDLKPYALRILAGLLGSLDSLFEPRNTAWPWNLPLDQAHWQRRAQWFKDGLHFFKNPGTDSAERRTYERAGSELEKTGLIRTGPREHIGLTDSGRELTRRVCRRLQLTDTLPGLDFILTLIGGPHEWRDDNSGGYFSESSLAGFDPWPRGTVGKPRLPDSAYWAVDALIPLLIADYVHFDFRPEFELPLYHLSGEGLALAQSRKKSGEADPSGWLKKLTDREQPEPPVAYSQSWQAMERFLQTAPPLNSNWVAHHLSINIDPRGRKATTAPRRQNKNRKVSHDRKTNDPNP